MVEHRQEINHLFEELRSRHITRRQFVQRAVALGLSVPAISLALGTAGVGAQGATPAASPMASPGAAAQIPGLTPGTKSMTRADYEKLIRENYPFEEVGNKGGQFIAPTSQPLATVNAILVADATSFMATQFVFESLIGQSVVDGNPAPGLADYWEYDADGVTYTFHLPENATWHDGTPVTADDVKFSYDSVLNEKVNSQYRDSVKGALKSYEVVDDHTFRMVAVDKLVTFLTDAVSGVVPIMAKHLWENVAPDKWANDPGSTGADAARVVGTGPFKFKESKDNGNIITLVPNENYYVENARPNIDEYIIQVYPDEPSTIQALKTGAVDFQQTIEFSQVADLKQDPNLTVVTYHTGVFWYYLTNLDPAITPLFQDVKARQALFYAIDRESLVKAITFGYAVVADGTQPVLSYAYKPDEVRTKYRFDMDKAKQLMDEAGWKVGSDGIREKDGAKFEVDWITIGGIPEYDTMLASIQQWWQELGVKMTPKSVEFATLLDTQKSHDFRIMNLAFQWTPPWNQGPMFRCDAYEGGFNYVKYCNPKFDELDDQQAREGDLEKRIAILVEQSNIVNDDLPNGILLFRDERVAYQKRVHNFFPSSFGGEMWSLNYSWLDKK
jgi:peptide/nickel transport system substrate-binding protein